MEDAGHRFANYLAFGNRLTFGNILFDLDFTNRAGIGQKDWLLSDHTIISKFI